LDGKPIQPTTSLPNAHTIPLVLNGMNKNIRQQRSITNRTSDSHFKPGTSSYAAACTKIRPPVIRQQTHHDDAPHHPRNLPKLQKNQVLSEQQELRNYSTNLSHAIPNARPSSYPLPANQHLNERPHVPTLCPTRYCPPKLRKSINPPTLTPSSTLMTPQTTTQQNLQKNHNWVRLHPFVGTTRNMLHSTTQPAISTPNIATTTQHPLLPAVNHTPVITTQTSTSRPKTFDSTHHPKLRPINRSTVHMTKVSQPDPTLRFPNYSIIGNHPAPPHRTTLLNDDTTNPALISRHKNCSLSPSTKDPHVSNSALNSLLSNDPLNPFMALKEVLSSLNKKIDRLVSIYAPLNTIVTYSATDFFPRTLSTFSSQNLPDIYELMIALPPMTYDDLLTHLHELNKHNVTALPTSLLQTNSKETTYSNNFPAIPYHMYYCTGNPDTLQKHLQQPPTHTRDLWKPP